MTTDSILDTTEAARYTGLKKATLDQWRSRGEGPKFVKLGRAVRYRRADLDAWIESRVQTTTQREK